MLQSEWGLDDVRAALFSDALDSLGLRQQTLGWEIHALTTRGAVAGRAYTVVSEIVEAPPERPYVGLLAALDAIPAGAICVFPTQRTDLAAMWGELLSTTAATRGAIGVVTDGLIRDLAQIDALGFPVYARGTCPLDIHGRYEVIGTQETVAIDGVTISPGDAIVADRDGVVVVPRGVEAEVVARVAAKSRGERDFRAAVGAGRAPSEAFEEFGVL